MQMWKNFGGHGHWSCPVFLWAGGKAGCWLRCRRCSLSAPAPTSLHGESPFQAVGVFSELPRWDGFLEPVIGFVVTDSERVGSTLSWLFFSHFSCLSLGKSLLLCYRFTEPFGYAFFLLPWDSQLPLWYYQTQRCSGVRKAMISTYSYDDRMLVFEGWPQLV